MSPVGTVDGFDQAKWGRWFAIARHRDQIASWARWKRWGHWLLVSRRCPACGGYREDFNKTWWQARPRRRDQS